MWLKRKKTNTKDPRAWILEDNGVCNARLAAEAAAQREDQKLHWLATAGYASIFPKGFAGDNERTLICLLARRIVDLEEKLKDLESWQSPD